MFTVRRMYDVPGPTLGDGVDIGTAETVDELRELLLDRFGVFKVTGSAQTVRLDLQAPIGDDRAFVEQLALAADGVTGPDEWVSQ